MMGKNKDIWPIQDLYQFSKPFKLKKARPQWANSIAVGQYVMSDPPLIVYHSHQFLNTGIPSVVWREQMKKAYIQRHNNMHMIIKTLSTYKHDY